MIEISQTEIDDLRTRLARTRWPEAETVSDWSQGVPLDYLRGLVRYWADGYDMRRLERRLARFPAERVEVHGVGIDLLHVRSARPDARAVIMTHGWPGSVVEFLEVIEPLTEDHHLVIPSLPGYGWSDKPTQPGTGVGRIARLWDGLMSQLGYGRYYAQGGDWGAAVSVAMSQQAPAGLAGVHVTLITPDPKVIAGLGDLSAEEQQQLTRAAEIRATGSGYSKQQSTRPQTLGYALADSPVGQLAWVIEKFWAWTDNAGRPEDAIDRDSLLDNVMVYWLTNTAASSARLYWESMSSSFGAFDPIPGPLAYSAFPAEIVTLSERLLATRVQDVRYYGRPAAGGHFAAFERPDLFIQEFRAGIAALPD